MAEQLVKGYKKRSGEMQGGHASDRKRGNASCEQVRERSNEGRENKRFFLIVS